MPENLIDYVQEAKRAVTREEYYIRNSSDLDRTVTTDMVIAKLMARLTAAGVPLAQWDEETWIEAIFAAGATPDDDIPGILECIASWGATDPGSWGDESDDPDKLEALSDTDL